MKKLLLFAAILLTSCTTYEEESQSFQYSQDDYCTMFAFVDYLHEVDLFNVAEPEKPTYDELMMIAAPVIMSDVFGDTLGEGDCSEVYFLMYAYFSAMYPDSSVTAYLKDIITNEKY